MTFAGIDGCKAGWLLITYKSGSYTWNLLPEISQLPLKLNDSARVFIDMPIGLPSKNYPRTIEKVLRDELENRRSTVFNVPAKQSVYESNRQKAKALNIEILGKSLSEQSLNIKSKIQEVDLFLNDKPNDLVLIESHPELCFKYLKGSVLQTKKSEKSGIEERLKILKKYDTACSMIYENIFKNTLRKQVKSDDIVDALVLCIANKLNGELQFDFLQDDNIEDEENNKIQIGYFDPVKLEL